MQKTIELVEKFVEMKKKLLYGRFLNSIEVLEHELKGFNPVTLYGKTEKRKIL